jgi:YD repeat-containing protein
MCQPSRRILAVVVTAAQLIGPASSWADVIPPINAPGGIVSIKRAYQQQPVDPNCPTDPLVGQASHGPSLDPFTRQSPGVAVAPSFNSGNKILTVWGQGWASESDQTMTLNARGSAAWMNGAGSVLNFFNLGTSSAPAYTSPIGSFVTLSGGSISSGAPTVLSERDADGTTRLFTVFESTTVLRLSKLTDKNGNTIAYSRDALGRLTHVQDVHGRFYDVAYDNNGYASKLTDSGGRTVVYTHDAAGHLTSEAGPVGTLTYQYDASNRMTQIGYPNGGVHNYVYDAQGRVTHEDDGSGQNALDYVFYGSSSTVTDALGRTTVYQYVNKQGYKKPTKVIDPAGNQTQYAYDSNYALAAQTDPLGRTTQYLNDAKGNVLALTDASGGRSSTDYDPVFSLPTLQVDPLDRTTVLSYDAQGDLTRVQDPMGAITRMSYDSMGHVAARLDPLSHETDYTYAANNGALASIVDPLSETTQLQTDPLSRVTKNTDPTNKATQYQYDAAGNVTQVTDALGHVTRYAYAPGRQSKLLSTVTDANGHSTTFGYDAQGRQTSVTNALNQSKTSQYDAKGNLIQTTNARGQVTTYTYDNLDRLTRKTMPEGQINYSYDAAGNITQITHYNGSSIQNTYDALNRLTQQVQTLPNGYAATIGYAYDATGNRTQMATPWGSFSYAYDADNRLIKIVNPQSKVFTFSYDAAGRRTQLNYPNGVQTSYTYDSADRVLSIIAKRTSDQVVVSSVAYTYDAAGNRTSMTDWEGTHSYSYDDLHRLTSAQHPSTTVLPAANETFSYDAVGNRLADAQIGGYTYDSANRLTQNGSFTYAYDADGSLANKTNRNSSTQTTYSFDSQSRLVGALLPDGTQWNYRYDVMGRRVERSSGSLAGQSLRYIYDGQDLVAILDAQNTLVQSITFGSGPGHRPDCCGKLKSVTSG